VLREDGQGTVELLGVVPALLSVGLVLWQLILVGHSAWMSAHAARAAARADVVGADPARAARSVLPDRLEPGLEVEADGGGAARVRVPVPVLHRGRRSPVAVAARTSLAGVR